MRRVEREASGHGSNAQAGAERGAVRVFRPQALARYLEPASKPVVPPADRPRSFAGLWLLVAALVVTGLLVASMLAEDLGYLQGGSLHGTPGTGTPVERGASGG